MNFFTQSEPPGSLLKRVYITTYSDDFGTPHSNQQQAGPRKKKPLLHPFPEKRDISLHPLKEKMLKSPRPVRDTGAAPPCTVQKKGIPCRPIQVKKVASPHPVRKVAPTCHGQNVASPNPGQKLVPPQAVEEEIMAPSHPFRKVAPASPLQKLAPPNHIPKVPPTQPVQENWEPPPCPVQKVTPHYPSTDNMAVQLQLYLENEAAQIQYNLQEKAARIHLNLEEKAAQIQLTLDKKEAEIQCNLEEMAAQIQINLERNEAEIQCNLENIAAQIQFGLEEKAAQIQCNMERKEAQTQLNLEAMLAQIQFTMEEKAAQIHLDLERKEAQIQFNLEEMATQNKFNLHQIAAEIQFNLEELGVLIQPNPEEMAIQRVEETASRIQHGLVLNGTLLHQELNGNVEKVSTGLSIESFLFHKVLGKGAFGKVMLAELKESGEYLAVKALKKEHILANNHVECTKVEKRVLALAAENPFLAHLHSTFQTKAKVMRLAHMQQYSTFHTNIMAICFTYLYSTFQTKDCLFFVMDFINGRDLFFHIEVIGNFDLHSTQFYAAEIICGLQFLHRNGVIYRDLKLNNVMLDVDGHIKIVDFGLCKDNLIDGKAMSFCGTEHYIAPEIFQGKVYSFPVDWWSLGVLVFEMLTGDSPFQGDDEDELSTSVCTAPLEFPNWLNQASKDLLEKLLERDPAHRLGVAGDIRAHPFFNVIDWPTLEKREMVPPFKQKTMVCWSVGPLQGDPEDGLLDMEFLSKVSCLSDRDTGSVEPGDQLAFAGFSFINPKWRG